MIEEGRNLVKHRNIFKEIFHQLKKVNMKIDKEDKGYCFLHSSLALMITFGDKLCEDCIVTLK